MPANRLQIFISSVQKELAEDRRAARMFIVKSQGRITNRVYRDITAIIIRSASRDLEDLVDKRVLSKVGTTGRNTFYILTRKLAIK